MQSATDDPLTDRRDWMGLLARASAGRLAGLWADSGLSTEAQWLRRPEIGSVMVRGRTGGTGAPFNLGETTVTRCSLRLADGRVGHAYVSGRDRRKAEIAALCDALMQGAEDAPRVRAAILVPLAREEADAREGVSARAEATRVEFFTLVRGED